MRAPISRRPLGSSRDYQGAKAEKLRPAASGWCSATMLSAIATLVPLAFVAGYGLAVADGQPGGLGLGGRASKGGGSGRLLSYDESALVGYSSGAGSDGLRLPTISIHTDLQASPAAAGPALPGADMLFVTWIAFGDFGDGGFKTHNFHKVDMRWADVARRSHPGCKIGLVLDQDTQLDDPSAVDFLLRINVDKKVYGRNEYNDFYHWTARYSFLEQLRAAGEDGHNVVFLDPDVFVLDDVHDVFEGAGFDYATTVSENPVQPVNGAMHFVRRRRYGGAIDVLKGVLASFQLKPEMGFTAGQQAYSDYFELTGRDELVRQLQESAVADGIACNPIRDGDLSICYVICTRYNFWEGCTDLEGMRIEADSAADYAAAHVKVFHFIAYRKLGMTQVYDAYMADGLQGAYAAWAALPHTEDGYKADARFASEA